MAQGTLSGPKDGCAHPQLRIRRAWLYWPRPRGYVARRAPGRGQDLQPPPAAVFGDEGDNPLVPYLPPVHTALIHQSCSVVRPVRVLTRAVEVDVRYRSIEGPSI